MDNENKKHGSGCCGHEHGEGKGHGKGGCCGGGHHKHHHTEGEGGGCCGGQGHHHDYDHDHEHHDHEHHDHDIVTLELEDGTELSCPVLDLFEVETKEYIALLHPVEETVLLYKFFDYEDGSIELTTIEEEDEYNAVSKAFLELNPDLHEIEE